MRKARFDVDEADVKPYLQLESVSAAAFDVAHRLFGVSFNERTDLPVYNPEVRCFEVTGKDGRHMGLFLGDYFARPSKRSGAWMSTWRHQHNLDAEEVRPIVANVMNFAKGAPGEPALLSMDDARTLFHEFGHGLHELLSNATYPTVSGARVEKDFVERSESESLAKVDCVIGGHPEVFGALRKFQENANGVTLFPGNHDVDLHWPAVQKRIRQELPDVNIEVHAKTYLRHNGRLRISHGHLFEKIDPANGLLDGKTPSCPTVPVVSALKCVRERCLWSDL